MNDKAIMKPESGMTAMQSFGGDQSLAQSGETLSTVLAAQAEAETKMRFFLAQQRPRSMDMVRTSLLAACERPGFAGDAREKNNVGSAWFNKPIGKGVEGFSIRFAEEVIRCYQNLDVSSAVVYENEKFRIVNIKVMDLETNISLPTQLVVEKLVERKFLKRGQSFISERVNSNGEPVFTVEATPDEVLQRQNSLISKAIRNAILRLVPGDILYECRERILAIRRGDKANDPQAYRKYICDKYAQIGVNPVDIEGYLGHSLNNISPPEQDRLGDLYDEIITKNLSWSDVTGVVGEKQEKVTDLDQMMDQQNIQPDKQIGKPRPTSLNDVVNIAEQEKFVPKTYPDNYDVRGELLQMASNKWPNNFKTVICTMANNLFKPDVGHTLIDTISREHMIGILDDLKQQEV